MCVYLCVYVRVWYKIEIVWHDAVHADDKNAFFYALNLVICVYIRVYFVQDRIFLARCCPCLFIRMHFPMP
jgi:hypothetical protein